MPLLEPVVISSEQYELRVVGPRSAVWEQSPAANTTVLARSDMVARPLPSDPSPESRDFASGSWTGRLNDAGEFTITFPNAENSDGSPWRSRFDPGVAGQRLQWIEIYQNGYLEFVGVIMNVEADRDQVQITGYDGSYLLKNAYERDWTVVEGPRDVFERGTQVWVPVTVDGFPAGPLSAQWTSSGSVAIGPSGGLVLTQTGSVASVTSAAKTVPSTGAWSAAATVSTFTGIGAADPVMTFIVTESTGDSYELYTEAKGFTELLVNGTIVATLAGTIAPAYGLLLESDGEWVWAFMNGQFVGGYRRAHAATTSLQTKLATTLPAGTVTVTQVLTRALQPFLM